MWILSGFRVKGPQTELRKLSQSRGQTLGKLRTSRILNKRAFLRFCTRKVQSRGFPATRVKFRVFKLHKAIAMASVCPLQHAVETYFCEINPEQSGACLWAWWKSGEDQSIPLFGGPPFSIKHPQHNLDL